jgi:hypothetical protein
LRKQIPYQFEQILSAKPRAAGLELAGGSSLCWPASGIERWPFCWTRLTGGRLCYSLEGRAPANHGDGGLHASRSSAAAFVADSYARTRRQHPEIELIGVMDRDGARAERVLFGLDGRRYSRSPKASWRRGLKRLEMDHLLGVSELAAAMHDHRPCRLSDRFALHVTAIALAMHQARETGSSTEIRSTLPDVESLAAAFVTANAT